LKNHFSYDFCIACDITTKFVNNVLSIEDMTKRITDYLNFRKIEYSNESFIKVIEPIMLNINDHITNMINKQKAFIHYLKDYNFLNNEEIENLPRFNT